MTQAAAGYADPSRNGDWIQTFTGLVYYPVDPRPEDISIIDVGHSLSNMCRFTGHVKTFYSVAEHSCRACDMVSEPFKFEALLHDGPEAYIFDAARPLKHSPEMTGYRAIEERNWKCFAERFSLPAKMSPEVKHADEVMLFTEKRDLMHVAKQEWGYKVEPLPDVIKPWSPKRAREEFLERFYEYNNWKSFEDKMDFVNEVRKAKIMGESRRAKFKAESS